MESHSVMEQFLFSPGLCHIVAACRHGQLDVVKLLLEFSNEKEMDFLMQWLAMMVELHCMMPVTLDKLKWSKCSMKIPSKRKLTSKLWIIMVLLHCIIPVAKEE